MGNLSKIYFQKDGSPFLTEEKRGGNYVLSENSAHNEANQKGQTYWHSLRHQRAFSRKLARNREEVENEIRLKMSTSEIYKKPKEF